jgi:hypothetical protein
VIWTGVVCLRIGASGGVLVNRVTNFPVPQNIGKFLSSCVTGGFSRRAQFREVS